MPPKTEHGWATIAFGPEAEGIAVAPTSLCPLALADKVELHDGRRLDGVLFEVVNDLALRGFDDHLAVHTDELMLVLVGDISRVEVS
jgi:hypothetical protein